LGDYTKELNAMTWSFSRCHSYENCNYAFYLKYIEKESDEQNFYAAFGKFCHEILEKIFKKEITLNEAIDYYNEKFYEEVNDYGTAESTVEKNFYLGLDYFENLDLGWLDDYEILGIEKKCLFTINKIKFIGFIDLLVQHKETKEIIVIDHKSSEYPIGKKGKVLKKKQDDYDNYKKQLYLYCEQVYKEYGVYPSHICWNYFKDQKWLKLPFIKEEYEEAKKWAVELIGEIHNDENFLPNLSYFYCNNLCGFRNVCDYKLMGGE